jgi:NADH-quinone oxidoreductase subunit J
MVVLVFLVAAALAVIFSIVAIAHRSPVVNVLALVLVFFALATVFALIGMDFLAAVQLIVYSGAILVLFLFVIMLLNVGQVERLGAGRRWQAALGALAALGLGTLVVFLASRLGSAPGAVLAGSERGTAFPIGRALVGSHLLAFELISVVLVAAIIGAVTLARREGEPR